MEQSMLSPALSYVSDWSITLLQASFVAEAKHVSYFFFGGGAQPCDAQVYSWLLPNPNPGMTPGSALGNIRDAEDQNLLGCV